MRYVPSARLVFFYLLISVAQEALAGVAINANVGGSLRSNINNGNTYASNSFSTTSADQLVLALVQLNSTLASYSIQTASLSGAGLTWVLAGRWNYTDNNAQSACAEIWRAFASTPITAQTVT